MKMSKKTKMTRRTHVITSVVVTALSILLFIIYTDRIQTLNPLSDLPTHIVKTTLCSVRTASCHDGINKKKNQSDPNDISWIRRIRPTTSSRDKLSGDTYYNERGETPRGENDEVDQRPIEFTNATTDYNNSTLRRERIKERTRLKNDRIEYSSIFDTTNTKSGFKRIQPSTRYNKPSSSKNNTNSFSGKTLSPKYRYSEKAIKTISGVPISYHGSNSTARQGGDIRYKTGSANDTEIRSYLVNHQQAKALRTADETKILDHHSTNASNSDANAFLANDDSPQTQISGEVFGIADGIRKSKNKASLTSQKPVQEPQSKLTGPLFIGTSKSKTDKQYTDDIIKSNNKSLILSSPSEIITASKKETTFDTNKDIHHRDDPPMNSTSAHVMSIPQQHVKAPPYTLSSRSSESADHDNNNNNNSLPSANKSLSYPEGETSKPQVIRYSPQNPRFSFPQTLDFVPTAPLRPISSRDLTLDGKLWQGRDLMKILDFAQASSSFETDYAVLQRHLESGGLNLSRLSREPWPPGAVLPWEMDLLATPPLMKLQSDSSYMKSKVTLLDVRQSYSVGDNVKFRIDVFDGKGEAKHQGGDEVRLWVVEPAKQAALAGRVTDLNNGSYLGEVVLRWMGTVKVRAELTFSKAAIRIHHYFRHVTKCARFVAAAYVNGQSSETTLCSPFPVIPGYKDVCNYTDAKYGIGWYCGKPRHANILCQNWVSVRDMEFSRPFPFSYAESKLFDYLSQQPFLRLIPNDLVLKVNGKPSPSSSSKKSRRPLLLPCSSRNFSETWDISQPRGYFFHRRWKRTDCRAPVEIATARLLRCLTNTTLVFTGDSNLLMLFNLLQQDTGCSLLEAPSANWHRPRSCTRADVNFHMAWALHGFPAHALADHWALRGEFQRVTTTLDAVPARGTFVVVVHLFIHLSMHHYSVFVDRMRGVRRAAEALLERNPDVTVVIRGPHTSYTGWPPVLGGNMMGTLLRQLTVRLFEGLHERVLFLDFWYMTVAGENPQFHPPTYINRAMLGVLHGHVCARVR